LKLLNFKNLHKIKINNTEKKTSNQINLSSWKNSTNSSQSSWDTHTKVSQKKTPKPLKSSKLFLTHRVETELERNYNMETIQTMNPEKLNCIKKYSVKRNGEILDIKPEEIVMGDLIFLKSGNFVPFYGVAISEGGLVDESDITGENEKVFKKYLNSVIYGSFVVKGEFWVLCVFIGKETSFQNTIDNMNEGESYSSDDDDRIFIKNEDYE
jgi:hypothetical protein